MNLQKFPAAVVAAAAWCCLFSPYAARAQGNAPVVKVWDGIVVAGYVDNGAYLNFTGPAIKWTRKPHQFLLGALPSLKIKKDPQAVKNSIVTPMLGVGVTWAFRHVALQVPLYYQPKTATADGRWKPGLGVGVKF